MSDKIVSLKEAFEKKKEKEILDDEVEEPTFDEIVNRNMENKKRMEEERKKANRSVIRSYRLKPR